MNRSSNFLRGVWLLLALVLSPQPSCPAVELGVARTDVTPSAPVRLTGYASRQVPSEGVEQKLWAKALAIGSNREGPAVLITLDNCGIADETWREVRARLARSAKIKPDRIVVASSHTHSGPATKNWAPNIFVQDLPPEQQAAIDRYTAELIGKLEQVALEALKNRQPGKLSWSQGRVDFARNRRTVRGNTAVFGDNAAAPVDPSLPVLKAETSAGQLLALVANYACHCTTLGGEFNHVCGDWAGYAQEAVEREQPGAVALITIGCGADANPFPRGGADFGLALAKQHGEELAAEVKRLLGQNFTPLPGKLATRAREIALPFGPHFTRDQWLARSTNAGIVGYHAKKWLARLDRGEKQPTSLYYPITTWNFGDDLALVFLPGEVVVDYSLRLKRELDAPRLWVSGYANYVPCYIPSRRILAEGGYEAEDSLWYYDRPARLSTNAEDLIIRTVEELVPKSYRADPKKAEVPDPKTPQQALSTFRTKVEFTVELVASEPLIESPVAIDWDAQGRLWVCEMYDYPSGLDGQGKPGGRIKILSSIKGDGRYDKAVLFLDGLSFPTGVMPWRKGALICAAPDILYAEDTDGDGRADLVRTNVTGFATHNFQARVNGFTWGLDGWLHGSSGLFGGKVKSLQTGREVDLSGRDFRYRPDTGEIEPVSSISQMGRVRDDFDNWFGNDNSTLLWHYPLPDHYLRRNPHVVYPDPRVNVGQASSLSRTEKKALSGSGTGRMPVLPDPNQLFPISRTLERFNDPQAANRVTSACGPCIYRDDLLGADYYGNAFVCEPVHNLVRRLVLEPDGISFAGRRADDEQRGEFLASTDNWFRPVQARTGPDGALYVVDMYRFVIEHPRWIPPERLKQLDPRAGSEMGRIYRVYPRAARPRPILDRTRQTPSALAKALNTVNGPTRDLVHRQLLEREASIAALPTKKIDWQRLAKSRNTTPQNQLDEVMATFDALSPLSEGQGEGPAVQVQALCVLDQMSDLVSLEAALTNSHAAVRRMGLRLAESRLRLWDQRNHPAVRELKEFVLKLVNDPDPSVRFQAAFSLGEWNDPAAVQGLVGLAQTDDRWLRAAVLSSATRHSAAIFNSLVTAQGKIDPSLASQLTMVAGNSPIAADWQQVLRAITPADGQPAEAWQWGALPGLLDALERNHISALALSTSSWEESRAAAERIWKSLAGARALATNESAGETERAAAIRLLGRGEGDRHNDLEVLFRFLQPGTAPRLQSAATEALRRQRGPRVTELALGQWNRASPAERTALVELMLGRDEWAIELLKAAEKGTVAPGEIALNQRPRLQKHQDPAIRERAEKLFGQEHSGSRADVIAKYQAVAQLAGEPGRGVVVFEKNCAQCHALRGRGHEVGPNLGEFAGKSAADFVQAIFDPSSAVNPNFIAYQVETQDGRSLSGIVRGETASGLTLVQGGGIRETILRSEVKEIRASTLSLMPEGLEQAMTPPEVADLIAWIKKSAPGPFGGASPEQITRARGEFRQQGGTPPAKVLAAGGQLPYPGWLGRLPLAFCRQDEGMSRLAWEMMPMREGEIIVFRLPGAMGFNSQPSGKFTLRLNDRRLFDFNVALADTSWQSDDGRARMNYTVMEANGEDSCGVLEIAVAAGLAKQGDAARFEVVGSGARSQRWFGVYLLPESVTAGR
jgi:putative membrane-bound dehydrogenase-like protein